MNTCRALGFAGIIFFLAVAFTPLPNLLSRHWGTPSRPRPAEAIVVLAAGVRGDGALTDGSLRRALHGIGLHRKGLAPLLVFTGPSHANGLSEAEIRAGLARELGTSPDAILTEPRGLTTRDEVIFVRALLQPRGVRRILLVTDSQHMSRARVLFERAGFEVFPESVDDVSSREAGPEQRLRLMRWVMKEFVARLYYWVAGNL